VPEGDRSGRFINKVIVGPGFRPGKRAAVLDECLLISDLSTLSGSYRLRDIGL
jgi:hypothetical protein